MGSFVQNGRLCRSPLLRTWGPPGRSSRDGGKNGTALLTLNVGFRWFGRAFFLLIISHVLAVGAARQGGGKRGRAAGLRGRRARQSRGGDPRHEGEPAIRGSAHAQREMLQFVRTGQPVPDQAPANSAAEDWLEVYGEFCARQRLAEQASRCPSAASRSARRTCPLHNNIPDWLMLTAEGRLEEAYEVSSATNNMPEIRGRICPPGPAVARGNCVIEQSGHGTVTIGAVEEDHHRHRLGRGAGSSRCRRSRRSPAASASSAPARAAWPAAEGTAQEGLAGPSLRPLRPRRRAR